MTKLRIPYTLNDLTLGQYMEFVKVQDTAKVEDVVAIFCDVSLEQLKEAPLEDVEQIYTHLTIILPTISRMEIPVVQIWSRNGQEYGLIPNLNDITYGEYIDLNTWLSGDEQDLDRAMSLMFRKVDRKLGKRYTIKPYTSKEYEEYNMRDMPLGIAMGAVGFIYALTMNLLQSIPSYISRQTQDKKVQDTQVKESVVHLTKIGEHTASYLLSLEKMLQRSTKLPSYKSINV